MNPNCWFFMGTPLVFGSVAAFGLYTENVYRRHVEQDSIGWRPLLPSLLSTFFIWIAYTLRNWQSVPIEIWPVTAGVAALFCAIGRVDRLSHLILNRFQWLGWGLGACFFFLRAGPWRLRFADLLLDWLCVWALWGLGLLYQKMRGRIGLGLGDIKLLLWLSLLTQGSIAKTLIGSLLLGGLWLCLNILHDRWKKGVWQMPRIDEGFAFAPMLLAATFLDGMIHGQGFPA